mgnify:CR=1 FL=1
MTEANIAKIVAGLSLIVNGFQSWIQKEFEKEMEKNLLQPEPDEYTEFDADRHQQVKGTLPPRMVKYGIHSIYRL